jgi:hypothetical protein
LCAEIEQEPSQHVARHIGEKAGIGHQYHRRNGRDDEAAQAAAAARGIVDRRPAQRNAADITAKRGGTEIGDAKRRQLTLQIRFAAGNKLDARGVEQHGDGGDEHDGEDVAA